MEHCSAGNYTCRAENIHGQAEHTVQLLEAREPTEIQQAVIARVCYLRVGLVWFG